jgi:hypothetical protein
MTTDPSKMAFPATGYGQGMTIREYFAAKMLEAILPARGTYKDPVASAVHFADALIKELNGSSPEKPNT